MAKSESASKKGNFGEILMSKICTKRILQHLSNTNANKEYNNDNSNYYELKN